MPGHVHHCERANVAQSPNAFRVVVQEADQLTATWSKPEKKNERGENRAAELFDDEHPLELEVLLKLVTNVFGVGLKSCHSIWNVSKSSISKSFFFK